MQTCKIFKQIPAHRNKMEISCACVSECNTQYEDINLIIILSLYHVRPGKCNTIGDNYIE